MVRQACHSAALVDKAEGRLNPQGFADTGLLPFMAMGVNGFPAFSGRGSCGMRSLVSFEAPE